MTITSEVEGRQEDQRVSQEETLSNWLPITASREAKWYFATFHNVTAMVGAGILGLPYAMSQLGWASGLIALFMSWLVTFYSLWQLVQLHERVPEKRFDRYHELGQHAFGPNLGFWIVAPQQLMVQIATDIVYMVTAGKSLKKSFDIVFPTLTIRKTYFTLVFSGIQLVLSQTPNFNSLKLVSLIAALMSLGYSGISFIASAIRAYYSHGHHINYDLRSTKPSDITFDVFSGLGTIAFAYAGHSVVLEIQATMPSTPESPSRIPMWRGVVLAYIIVALCYFSVSALGYLAFGNLVDDDILVSLEKPSWLIAAANLMVFFHVMGSYQVFAMPVFDMIESQLIKKFELTPGRPLRIIARSVYVVFTTIVGVAIPFFGGLLAFFGGLVFAPTTYVLPSIVWLTLEKPKAFSFHWISSWVAIIIGVGLMLCSPIGGIRQIIRDAKTYTFFS